MNIFQLLWVAIKVLIETILGWILPARYKSVEGEVCLITGAGNGIGRLIAIEYAKRKAKLILWDIDKTGVEETGAMVRELGAQVFTDVCDLSQQEQIAKAAEKARTVFGDVTILVNNAGITYCKDLLDLSQRQIEMTFKVNVMAHFWTLREFLPSMQRNNHGHIVTTASVVGLIATAGMPDYNSSKHAAVGLHQSIYFDLQKKKYDGIKMTLLCPYHITTGLFKGVQVKKTSLLESLTPDEVVQAVMHATLTNREFVALPRLMYASYNTATWLPMRLQAAFYSYVGANESLDTFVPNRPYQKSD